MKINDQYPTADNAVTKQTRRSFVKNVAALSSLTLLGSLPRLLGEVSSGEKPTFRFVYANDLHFTAPIEGIGKAYADSNERSRWLMQEASSGGLGPIDFLLLGGDIVHGETLDNLDAELPAFKDYLSKFPLKVYPAVGNHENIQQEADPVHEKAYWEAFGKEFSQYSFEHKGIVFVVLNNSGDPPSTKANPDAQKALRVARLEFLKQVVASHPGKPVIVVCHIPLVAMREPEVLERSFGFISWKSHDDALVKWIDSHSENVRAVLSGHLHITGVVEQNGVWYVVPSGLASYPHDFAVFEVFEDRIDVRMASVPASMARREGTTIHGTPRHQIDYTDTKHTTHDSYIKGTDAERSFSIPLKPSDGEGTKG